MTLTEELSRLEDLYRRGALTDSEFAQAKRRLLEASTPAETAARLGAWRRSASDRWFGGVCGGLGRSTGVESWLWRLLFTLFVLLGGTGLLLYVLLWVFVPVADLPLPASRQLAS